MNTSHQADKFIVDMIRPGFGCALAANTQYTVFKFIILVIFAILLFIPAKLAPGTHECYAERWPTRIMQAGSFEYWMDKPGGKVRMVEK